MRHVGHIFGIAFVTVLFFLFIYFQTWFLDANPPQPLQGVKIEQWMASFQAWAFVCLGTAGFASLLWYFLAQRIFKINRWEDTEGKRPIWLLLSLLPIVAIVVSCICVEQADSSLIVVYLFFILNGLFPYYLATLLFSPSAFKYTPAGAKQIRFW